jgi:hypothetical protein
LCVGNLKRPERFTVVFHQFVGKQSPERLHHGGLRSPPVPPLNISGQLDLISMPGANLQLSAHLKHNGIDKMRAKMEHSIKT